MGSVIEPSQDGSEILAQDMVHTMGGDHQQLDQLSRPPKQLWARECRALSRAVFLLGGPGSGPRRDSCRECLSGLLERLLKKPTKEGPATAGPLLSPAELGVRHGSFPSDFLRALRMLLHLLAGPESVSVHGSFLGPVG